MCLVMRGLIVGNEPGTRKALGGLLRHAGDDVTWADGGPANWEGFAPSSAPLIVLLDSDTAGFDALEACRRIRALPAQASAYTYLILLAGGDGKAATVDGWQAVADDCLTRPLQLGEVEARLRVARRIVELETRLAAQRM